MEPLNISKRPAASRLPFAAVTASFTGGPHKEAPGHNLPHEPTEFTDLKNEIPSREFLSAERLRIAKEHGDKDGALAYLTKPFFDAGLTNTGDPADANARLLSVIDDESLSGIATDPKTPAHVLSYLAQDPHPGIRGLVGKNESTPIETQRILASDKSWMARIGVSGNPNAPEDLQIALATDEHKQVRGHVGLNRNACVKALDIVAGDTEVANRMHAAGNLNLSEGTIARLSTDKEGLVREQVARNQSTSPEVLSGMVKDEHLHTINGLLHNPNTPGPAKEQALKSDAYQREQDNIRIRDSYESPTSLGGPGSEKPLGRAAVVSDSLEGPSSEASPSKSPGKIQSFVQGFKEGFAGR